MTLPDVNVLVYAFRSDSPHHEICREWLKSTIAGNTRFGLSPFALAAVVRVTTNPRAFNTPSTLDASFGFCNDLLRQPRCQLVVPGERHWTIFQSLCKGTQTTARRTTDAWYAALAIEWGCQWITLDRDYYRFPGLTCKAP